MVSDEAKDAGFALAAVLGFLMLLAALLTPFAISSRVRGLTAANTFEAQRLSLAADAINATLASLLLGTTTPLSGDQLPERCVIDGFDITVSVREQHGLVDLNYASPALLLAGLKALGLADAEASVASRAIRAFRSVSNLSDDNDETETGLPDGLKHGPFEDVVELQEIPELRSYSLAVLREHFTVHSKSGQIVSRSANPVLVGAMRSLGLGPIEGAVPGRPTLRISTSIHSAAGAGASDGVYELSEPAPRRLVSEGGNMEPFDVSSPPACLAPYWSVVRSLVSRGLGA